MNNLPDERYRWVVVALTLLLQAVAVGTTIYTFSLLVMPWIEDFGSSRAEVMFAISLSQVSTGLVSPWIGSLMDRVRMRSIVVAGVAILAAGWALLSIATALWQVVVIYATFFPVGMGLMGTLASQTLITRWFPDKRGLAIGLSATGTNIGGIVLPLYAGYVLASGDWRPLTMSFAFLSALVVIPLAWLVLSRRSPRGEPGVQSTPTTVLSTKAVLTSRRFWVPVIGLVPLNMTFGAVQFNLGAYATDLNLADHADTLIATISVCMIIGKFFFGGLSDRVPLQALYWFAATLMIAALFLLQDNPNITVLFTSAVCLGLASGSLMPLMALFMAAMFDVAQFGRVMGLMMLSLSFASIGPILAGFVFDSTGSYDLAFMLFAGLIVPGMVAMLRLPKRQAGV